MQIRPLAGKQALKAKLTFRLVILLSILINGDIKYFLAFKVLDWLGQVTLIQCTNPFETLDKSSCALNSLC